MSSLQSIGQELKEARLSRGLSLEEVAASTRIAVRHLQSLEEGNEAALPEPFYIKSFIIKYANALGLPGSELAGRYWVEKKEVLPAKPPAAEGSPWWVFPSVATFALILAVGVAWWVSQGRHSQVTPVSQTPQPVAQKPLGVSTPSKATVSLVLATPSAKPSPHPTVHPSPTPSPLPSASAIPSPTVPPATASLPSGKTLVVKTIAPCWMVVTADGKTLFSGMMREGEKVRFNASHQLTIRMGNAGGVHLTFGDQDLGTLGKTGEVVERTFTVD